MKILITGANGFIGKHVVTAALESGHTVVAISRTKHPSELASLDVDKSNLILEQCEFKDFEKLTSLLTSCDAVIHLAAVMSGDNQYQQTLEITQQLLKAIEAAKVKRLVLISSISVLNYIELDPFTLIDENISICFNDLALGNYAKMKRDQEKLCRQWKSVNNELVILRPGLVYGGNNLSDAHAGFFKKGLGIAALHKGDVPLAEVRQTAQNIISATTKSNIVNDTIHLLDSPSINQQKYIDQLQNKEQIRFYLPVPWKGYLLLGNFICKLLKLIKKENKIPESFRENSISARQKPFKFSSAKADLLLKN